MIQCFGIYMAIVSYSTPKCVTDLIDYQSLIIGASQNCREGQWTIYIWSLFPPKSISLPYKTVVYHRHHYMEYNISWQQSRVVNHRGVIPQDLLNSNPSQHPARQRQFPTKLWQPKWVHTSCMSVRLHLLPMCPQLQGSLLPMCPQPQGSW